MPRYFPFLRGRRYELAILGELAEAGRLADHIVPIVEPVLLAGLRKNVRAWNDRARDLILVVNPRGGMKTSVISDVVSAADELALSDNHVRAGILVSRRLALGKLRKLLDAFDAHRPVAIHLQAHVEESKVVRLLTRQKVLTHVFLEKTVPPGYSDLFAGTRVLLRDGFQKKARNADYPDLSSFDSPLQAYAKDGFGGFGDFTIIGDHEGTGGIPRSVAIHLTHFAPQRRLLVRHLVSNTKSDVGTARMFLSSLEQLPGFLDGSPAGANTPAVREFLSLLAARHFPGLGRSKCIAARHHIELIATYLEGNHSPQR